MEIVQEHVEETDPVRMEYGVGHLQCVLVSCLFSSCAGIQSLTSNWMSTYLVIPTQNFSVYQFVFDSNLHLMKIFTEITACKKTTTKLNMSD